MRLAPSSFRSLGFIAFTVGAVPTGAKTGVSSTPCGVCSRPARALLSGSAAISSNSNMLVVRLRPWQCVEIVIWVDGGLLRRLDHRWIVGIDAPPLGRQQPGDLFHHRMPQIVQSLPAGATASRAWERAEGL